MHKLLGCTKFLLYMTYEDFKKVTKRKNVFDKYWHYIVAISFGLFFLFGLYYITFINPDKFRHTYFVVYPVVTILLIICCLSAFRLLPNRYKIIDIYSSKKLFEKEKIASSIASEYCGFYFETKTNYFVGQLKRRWWQSKYTLHFFYNDHLFAFSLQGHDSDGGWIDFGETERKRKKIREHIEKLISV